MLSNALQKVMAEYTAAKQEAYAAHPLALYIRSEFKSEVEGALGEFGSSFECEGSAGAGNWASVPWVGIFDPLVTDSATRGYYLVYLFSSDKSVCYLSPNQGATSVLKEFKNSHGYSVLRDRAVLIRERISEFSKIFPLHSIELGSKLRLPKGYEAGHAIGKSYQLSDLPSDNILRKDLHGLIRAYLTLTYRGGLEPTPEFKGVGGAASVVADKGAMLTEVRQYRLHRKIDRHPKASKEAKKYHGTVCQACGFSFAAKYGEIGDGFIEAHHLRPLGGLDEGVPVTYEVATDFAVLCSNCHRMIHQTNDPSDIEAFRRLIQSR